MKSETVLRGLARPQPCHYGISKLPFRGPRRPTDGRYVAFLGGSETFAKYIRKPYPDLIETAIGEVCVNLGCQSAGPDVFLQDTALQSLCHDATVTVIQIVGATNQNNAYYKVHPRRNDRFIAATPKLRALYPEIDFTEISFTGHLISRLRAVDEERFKLVRQALEATWVRRMKSLVGLATGPVLLLWFGSRAPEDEGETLNPAHHPVFVTRPMIETLRPYVADVVEVVRDRGILDGMHFAPLEALAAQDMLGVSAHKAAAKALRGPLLYGLG